MEEQRPKLEVLAGTSDGFSDDELMLLVKEGHQSAFGALVHRYQSIVLGCANRYFNDAHQARDVAQDVFVSLWSERDRYHGQGKFKGYLLALTFNRCHVLANRRRVFWRKLSFLSSQAGTEVQSDQQTPMEVLLANAKASRVRREVERLPHAQKEALILRFQAGYSLQEIADQTATPVGSVKSNIFRGLKRLRELLSLEAP